MPFSKLGLDAGLLVAIKKSGYARPTPVQQAAVPKIMQGHDVIGIAQTGTGKTAAFVWPILHRLNEAIGQGRGRAISTLILVPTRELALQITDNIRHYGQALPVRVTTLFGGVEEQAQVKALHKGCHIVVATPGRLLDLAERQKLDFSYLDVLVLDEADRMLHMGFLPDIEAIVAQLPKRRQTLMFSATLSKDVESLARRFLFQPKMVQIGNRFDPAETVEQAVYEVPARLKSVLLVELLRQPGFTKVLVFVRMKDGANRLTNFLRLAQIKVGRLHSSRSQEERLKALHDFEEGRIQVLVATDIVARGIDIEGVTHVVNFDFPVNPEDYVHRIGRTGRAEAAGTAISLVPEEDLNLLQHLEMFLIQRLPRKRLRGFDYRAPGPPPQPGEKSAKQDWRKRTRERAAKQAATEKPPAKAKRTPARAVKKSARGPRKK